jgi:hypothetical protein
MATVTISANSPGSSTISSAQRARLRALVVPREHGAWGLLLVPLFTGVAIGAESTQHAWPVVLFTVASLSLFWMRTPVESLLGTTAMRAQSRDERGVAWSAALGLGAITAACLSVIFWHGYRGLLLSGAAAAAAFAIQTALMKLGLRFRMTAQLIGAAGLTAAAPAAYYVATHRLDAHAWLLWAANWIFAGNQIHFVQVSIHGGRANGFREKIAQGKAFFVGQVALSAVLVVAAAMKWMPAWYGLAFVPALVRGFRWFFLGPRQLQVRALGWSEMRQGIGFGLLLAGASFLR